MSQPVELIVANCTHDMVERIDAGADLAEQAKKVLPSDQVECKIRDAAVQGFARHLLCQIAHRATDHVVRKALAALGAPHEDDHIWARLEAARDAQNREAGESTTAN